MTLLVALTGKDGIVLAADSRGTFGDPRGITAQNDTMNKTFIIAEQAAVLVAGSGEVGTLLLQDFAAAYPPATLGGATAAVTALRAMARQKYGEWFPSLPAVAPQAMVQAGQIAARPDLVYVVAGHDAQPDGSRTPAIYQLTSAVDFAPMLHNYGFAVAGVPQYALYLLNRLYQPERTIEELAALAVYAITETASQDGKVGGPVRIITIPVDGQAQALSTEAVREIMDANEQRSENLKNSFFEPATEK